MIKVITSTWGHTPQYNIENTITYRSFIKYNNPENFVNFYFGRGIYHAEEIDYGTRLGVQAEYILYKIDLLREKVEQLDTDYIIFCDANDVCCCGPIEKALDLFDLDNLIVFSAERNDWPKADKIAHWENYRNYHPWDRQNRMFLNSGVQLAKKSKYLELLNSCMENFVKHNIQGHGGDQGVFAWHYNMIDEPKIKLDYANIFALSTYDSTIDDYYRVEDKIYSKKFGTSPLFLNDNGSGYGGQRFAQRFMLA
jgi:hypothetical protein